MNEPKQQTSVILKILSGVQTGVEVLLTAGEYSVGSSSDDDIQLIDVSLKPAHAKLRISAGKIEIAGAKGALRAAHGLSLDAASEWQEIEPLDIVTAGTTRFALGPLTANWASITEEQGAPGDAAPARRSPRGRAGVDPSFWARAAQIGGPVAAVLLLLVVGAWSLFGDALKQHAARFSSDISDLQLVREALGQFPFGRRVEARQDVDGTIYVNGYVDTPVERRALAGALEKTGVAARVRLWVLQTIRAEVESLVAAQKVNVAPNLSPEGVLTLDGVILSEASAGRFIELVNDRTFGISRIQSNIKTAKLLLGEVERLAQSSQVQPWILLRLDNDLIEANGAVPIEKVDAWVGFLQSFARRFSKDIALRSFVQLQNASGKIIEAPGAIVIGEARRANSDIPLDVDRLKQGSYKLSEVFAGETRDSLQSPRPAAGAPATAANGAAGPHSQGASTASGAPASASSGGGSQPVAPRSPLALVEGAAPGGRVSTPEPLPSLKGDSQVQRVAGAELGDASRRLLEGWRDNRLSTGEIGLAFRKALDVLNGDGESLRVPEQYLPLLSDAWRRKEDATKVCWPGSQLTPENLAAVLFWLDLFSASDSVSITSVEKEAQALLIEAALNPTRATECAKRLAALTGREPRSLYLREIGRNPDFVRFIVRDVQRFQLDVAGASLAEDRFILTRAGRKMYEGAAPDRASRIAHVGELGVAVQIRSGFSTMIFGPEMNWKVGN